MNTLKDTSVGKTVKVVKLHGDGPLKRRVMDMGITKGVEIFVRKVAPLGDPVEITVRGYELSIRRADAEIVRVGQPETEALLEIVVAGDLVVIAEAVRTFADDPDRDAVLVFGEPFVYHSGDELLVKPPVFFDHILHMNLYHCLLSAPPDKRDLSVCCRYEHNRISVQGLVIDAPAARAVPLMPCVEEIRPVRRPLIDVQRAGAVREQGFIHCFEVFRLVSSAVNRLHQSIPVRNRSPKVLIIWFPLGIIPYVAKVISLHNIRTVEEHLRIQRRRLRPVDVIV